MSDFLTAYKKTAINEGGWNHVPGDRGGETYKGIARNFFPNWPGWKIIDKLKPLKHGAIINNADLNKLVHQFYIDNFWNKIRGNEIVIQEVADSLYDSAVNFGVKTAVKLLQRSLQLTETGSVSNFLINKLNNQ